jgi:hypothetical protein
VRGTDLAMEVTRSLYDVAREYVESFDIYGSAMSYEWQQLEREDPVVFAGDNGARVKIPDFGGARRSGKQKRPRRWAPGPLHQAASWGNPRRLVTPCLDPDQIPPGSARR